MKLDRLMGILTLLLQSEKVTAPELARRFVQFTWGSWYVFG